MKTMKVVGAKLSRVPKFNKFIYEKEGILYVKSGEDDYKRGYALQTTLKGACRKWGYYEVENPPTFRDGQELMDNAKNFELRHGIMPHGKVVYSGFSL